LSNLIIVDRKHKRKNFDNDWSDPFSLDETRKEKARTISIERGSSNAVHRYIEKWGHKAILGKRVFALNDRQEPISGYAVDVIPPDYIHLKNKGVVRFKDCISIGE
jgi:hypothetical protein